MTDSQEGSGEKTVGQAGVGGLSVAESIVGTDATVLDEGRASGDTVLSEESLTAKTELGVGETQASSAADGTASDQASRSTWPRMTVLPRIEALDGGERRLVVETQRRYEAHEVLGEGASGEVSLSLDNDIQRLVAMKRLKSAPEETPALSRFVDEIRLVGSLEHPNIVPIHDVGIDEDGHYYFVMKRIEGETLESVIAKLAEGEGDYHRKYTFEYRVSVFMEICKAVEFAHHKGIIHRDLKPANVMVGPHGEVVVMDWGIAKNIRESERPLESAATLRDGDLPDSIVKELDAGVTGGSSSFNRMARTECQSIIGTPAYMSPEQVTGRTELLDERSDVYSLCALLYEFLALTPYLPPKKTMKELLVAVLTDEPKTAHFQHHPHQSQVPAQYSNFLIKGLQKSPEDRYQSVVEMLETLQRIKEGYFGIMCPVSLVKRPLHGMLHFIDKHPTVTLASLALLSLAFLGGLVYVVL